MASWAVDPTLLTRRVPAGTELDQYDGVTYLSLVAFQFRNTKVLGIPVPGHRNFEEINLRFYVRRDHPDGARRGVVFLREIVPRPLIAMVARRLYHEPYVFRATRSDIDPPAGSMPGTFTYRWKESDGWRSIAAMTEGQPRQPESASLEAFIAEHYWGYNTQPDGGTMEYRVAHPPWRVWQASARCEMAEASSFGPEFAPILKRPPDSVFVADGSAVTVYRGEGLTGGAPSMSTLMPRHLP